VTGEVLSQTIIQRSLTFHREQLACPPPIDTIRLRKVSDADSVDTITTPQLELVDEPLNETDLSLFVDLRRKSGSLRFRRKEIPPMLTISIVTEETLRNMAIDIVSRMTLTFDDEALRLFLGYKACSLKRERLLQLLSDHLFDVSHAMFAWKQTESEMLAESEGGHKEDQESDSHLSKLIQHSLFDQRALKKIGGFDNSSLLPHALVIEACEKKKQSWETFAKTKRGLEMLRHHKEGKTVLVGQKRRGQRLKSRLPVMEVPLMADEQGIRSRSSSISTMENDDQCFRSADTASASTELTEISFADKSEVLQLTLKRQPGKPWGVLLAREGDLCLVDRAPAVTNSLRRGDMVLSVCDEHGEGFQPPSSSQVPNRVPDGSHQQQDWFRSIVGLFKMSHELHLTVRRV